MRRLSRRSFVAATAAGAALGAIPFPIWFERHAGAQTALTRCNIQTPAGAQMAEQYARAVQILTTTVEADPRSWIFQWYTHWVKATTTKAAEIARIYPDAADPRRGLAQEAWNTCQPHGSGSDRMMFLPWHRMFVYFYERILRSILNDPSFALPYWNYSPDSGFPFQRSIPPQFRSASDPLYGVLYRSSRKSGINTGRPIDKGQESSKRLHLVSSLSQTGYAPQGAISGFCNRLNSHLHANVHGLVGNSQGMGDIKWAGNDPLFWMHHSNIDRIWESWNAAGHGNPTSETWLGKSFVFADEVGQRVVATVRDFVDPTALGYAYDNLESAPPPVAAASAERAAPREPTTVVAAGRLALGARPVRVLLRLVDVRRGSFADRVRKLPADRRLYLVLEQLHARATPEIIYDLYLNLPPGATGEEAQAHRVGDINFFEAAGHEGHDTDAFFSYDITDVARNLLEMRRLGFNAVVTVVPAGIPAVNARPEIGRLSIVEQ
jgi:tyrosinase